MRTHTKRKRVPSRATMGRTILSPQNRTTQPNPNEVSAGVAAPVIASCSVNAATAR